MTNHCNCSLTSVADAGVVRSEAYTVLGGGVIFKRKIRKLRIRKWISISIYCVNCSLVDTRWQQYSTHLHTNSTQNNTIKNFVWKAFWDLNPGSVVLIQTYCVNCSLVDTRWQQYSTHLHTNSTQNNTINNLEAFLGFEPRVVKLKLTMN